MKTDHITEPSCSPWASPVVLVSSPNSKCFFVDYYWCLNKKILTRHPWIISRSKSIQLFGLEIMILAGGNGWVQSQKWAFITSFSLYQFKAMTVWLKNSEVTFQRLMEWVLADLRRVCCFEYIDDMIMFSKSKKQYLKHLRQVFKRLDQAALTFNLKKWHFFRSSLTLLGYVVSEERVAADQAVTDYPKPWNILELQRFLRLAGWYHKFIRNFSNHAAFLNHLKRKGVVWVWTEMWTEIKSFKGSPGGFPGLSTSCPVQAFLDVHWRERSGARSHADPKWCRLGACGHLCVMLT